MKTHSIKTESYEPEIIRKICADLFEMNISPIVRESLSGEGRAIYHLRSRTGARLQMMPEADDQWAGAMAAQDGALRMILQTAMSPFVHALASVALTFLKADCDLRGAEYLHIAIEPQEGISRIHLHTNLGRLVVHRRSVPERGPGVSELVLQLRETNEFRRYYIKDGAAPNFSYDVLQQLPF